MALRNITLAAPVVVADITAKGLTNIEIHEVDGVATVFYTFMEPDSRGVLRPQTLSKPLLDTITSVKFEAWLDSVVS